MTSYLVIAQQVAGKELRSFFNSPSAYLFLAAFLGAVLFNFFWLEVFARNIADVRPLFEDYHSYLSSNRCYNNAIMVRRA